MCQLHLEHIDNLDQMIARLDAQMEQMMIPFCQQWDLPATIPGIGPIDAAAIISEIGTPSRSTTTGGLRRAPARRPFCCA
jgi:transposase